MPIRCLLPTLILLAFGCTGSITGTPETGGDNPGTPASPLSVDCADVQPSAPYSPLRRLNQVELRNTLSELFGDAIESETLMVPHDPEGPVAVSFYELLDSPAQVTDAATVEDYFRLAGQLSTTLVANWVRCDVQSVECAQTTIEELLPRAFRRPPSESEARRYETFIDENSNLYGPEDALRMALHALLTSPDFLYLVERGDGVAEGSTDLRLSDYELASRLSYTLWATMPDDALMSAAARGELRDPETFEAQVRRMLADPKVEDGVGRFLDHWAYTGGFDVRTLPAGALEEYGSDIGEYLRDSLHAFMMAQFREGTVASLFASEEVYVDENLAPILALDDEGAGMRTVEGRAGVLTQPGWLASTSGVGGHSPILRGVYLLERVLCNPMGAPPQEAFESSEGTSVETHTTREAVELAHSRATCTSCHQHIDGAGFLFENYDSVGAYREEENGHPVDASGRVQDGGSWQEFDDASELAAYLSGASNVRACLSTHFLDYALARHVEPNESDACHVQEIVTGFEESDSLQDMILQALASPAFSTIPGR